MFIVIVFLIRAILVVWMAHYGVKLYFPDQKPYFQN